MNGYGPFVSLAILMDLLPCMLPPGNHVLFVCMFGWFFALVVNYWKLLMGWLIGEMCIGEYSPRWSQGEYLSMFTKYEANNINNSTKI